MIYSILELRNESISPERAIFSSDGQRPSEKEGES